MTTAVPTRQVRPLKGPDKAAALLLAMGRPLAGRIMSKLEPEEIKLATRAIAELRPISAEQLEELIESFADELVRGPHLFGNLGEVARMLEGVLPPEQVAEILADMEGRANQSIWDRVS